MTGARIILVVGWVAALVTAASVGWDAGTGDYGLAAINGTILAVLVVALVTLTRTIEREPDAWPTYEDADQ